MFQHKPLGLITSEERIKFRSSLARLTSLMTLLEASIRMQDHIPAQAQAAISRLTSTEVPESQMRAMTEIQQKTEDQYMARLKEAAPWSLSCMVEYFTPDEVPAPHHEFMIEHLEALESKELMRMLLSMPPGHAKTKFCSRFFPAWYLGRNSYNRYLQGGHSQAFVENEFGKVVREIVNDDRYSELFPETILSRSTKGAGNWKLSNNRGGYVTKGVGQGIAGYRGNIGGIDDPFASREDAESAIVRQKTYDWFNADFTTRLLPGSPLFIVATRWHPDDLCGRVEEWNSEGKGLPWTVINLPVVYEDDSVPDPLGRNVGDFLWPEYYTEDMIKNLKETLPPRDWNSLYMGTPVSGEGNMINIDWVNRYEQLPRDRVDPDGNIIEHKVRRITVSADVANKDGERNDYTAITVWVESMSNQHFLAHVFRKRMMFEEMCTKVNNIARVWGANAILIEDQGAGTQYIQTQSGIAPAPVIPIATNNKSKAFRFDGVTPMYQAGEVFHPKRASWLANYERELLQFPLASNDDQVDSTSQYLAWARKRTVGGTKRLRGSGLRRA
jgi:predicted phage terminase large subunit-like protein